MNLLFLEWPCFGLEDALDAFEKMGFNIFKFSHDDYQKRRSEDFDTKCKAFIRENSIDFVFSFNYHPVLAQVCHDLELTYVSFVYDSPHVMLYSYTTIYPTNHIFVFDYSEYAKFASNGITTVHYSILPANAEKIKKMLLRSYDRKRLSGDVTFVGALYGEQHNFYDLLGGISDHTRGYLEGIMEAQLQIQGYSFVEETLPKDVVEDVLTTMKYGVARDGIETREYIVANYVLGRQMTRLERTRLLTAVAEKFPLKFFTIDPNAVIPGGKNMGVAEYVTEMPIVFHNSKINLNISLRSIKTGIPLRCMDIMASGGFLLTNYQEDLLRHFTPDEDFVYYEDQNDLLAKIDYYLSHDKERNEIAENGHRKVKENYSFDIILRNILNESGIEV